MISPSISLKMKQRFLLEFGRMARRSPRKCTSECDGRFDWNSQRRIGEVRMTLFSRQVSKTEVETWMKANGVELYFETSAKTA
jgi:hypothetical protein